MNNSEYLQCIYSPHRYRKTIKDTIKSVKKFIKKNKVDAIAFTGTSGAAVAYPVGFALDLPLLCIRKGSSHFRKYGGNVEGEVDAKKYIIIDDFIETGRTIKKIIKNIEKNHDYMVECDSTNKKQSPKCVAIFLYKYNGWKIMFDGIPIIKTNLANSW